MTETTQANPAIETVTFTDFEIAHAINRYLRHFGELSQIMEKAFGQGRDFYLCPGSCKSPVGFIQSFCRHKKIDQAEPMARAEKPLSKER